VDLLLELLSNSLQGQLSFVPTIATTFEKSTMVANQTRILIDNYTSAHHTVKFPLLLSNRSLSYPYPSDTSIILVYEPTAQYFTIPNTTYQGDWVYCHAYTSQYYQQNQTIAKIKNEFSNSNLSMNSLTYRFLGARSQPRLLPEDRYYYYYYSSSSEYATTIIDIQNINDATTLIWNTNQQTNHHPQLYQSSQSLNNLQSYYYTVHGFNGLSSSSTTSSSSSSSSLSSTSSILIFTMEDFQLIDPDCDTGLIRVDIATSHPQGYVRLMMTNDDLNELNIFVDFNSAEYCFNPLNTWHCLDLSSSSSKTSSSSSSYSSSYTGDITSTNTTTSTNADISPKLRFVTTPASLYQLLTGGRISSTTSSSSSEIYGARGLLYFNYEANVQDTITITIYDGIVSIFLFISCHFYYLSLNIQ
jgi:hypothetical protein